MGGDVELRAAGRRPLARDGAFHGKGEWRPPERFDRLCKGLHAAGGCWASSREAGPRAVS